MGGQGRGIETGTEGCDRDMRMSRGCKMGLVGGGIRLLCIEEEYLLAWIGVSLLSTG